MEAKLLQKIFNIYLTIIKRGLTFNYKGYRNVLDKHVIFDILTLSAISPDEINKLPLSKDINLINCLKDSLHSFIYDCFNAIKLILASLLSENIIISSRRWVKDKKIYQNQFNKILDLKSDANTKFIYFKGRNYLPRNKITFYLREKLYIEFLNNFDQLIENYQKVIKSKFGNKADHVLSTDNYKEIKNILRENYNINIKDRNLIFIVSLIIKIFYKILNHIIITFIRRKNIYIINTNLWSVGNIVIENILLNKEIKIIGCQHGAGYKERKFLAIDHEIYCPAFYKFVGFSLFEDNVSASQILNLKPIDRGEVICYINGSGANNEDTFYYPKECIEIISKFSIVFKCSIRVHPRQNIRSIQKIIYNKNKNDYDLNNLNIFKANNKFESISNSAKICIFDNPHNTLFWEAYSRGIKTILIYDVNLNPNISKDFLEIFDCIINPSINNWQSKITKKMKSLLDPL